jgi:branched-chain amino acid aminotransferase
MRAVLDGTPTEDPRVPATDTGLLRGDGAFEVVRVYGGRPFALDDHLARLRRSCAGLRLEADLEAVRGDVATLLDGAGAVDAAVRIVLTRGGRRLVLLEDLPDWGPTIRLACVTYAPTRLLDGIKSLSYAPNVLATRLAREQGADEALLVTPHGRVLEAPTSAVFVGLGGRLVTPPLEDHVLDSITRRRLLGLVPCEERPVTREDLRRADEAFLASTTREVHPVASVDGEALPAAPGPLTSAAAEAFRAHVAGS